LEMKQTKKLIKDKYDIVMPDTETARLVTLIKELEWWQKASAKSDSPRQFREEQLDDLRELLEQSGGQNLSRLDVRNHATSLLALVPMKEKQRVADEIRGILVEHRPVAYEPVVAKKTAELLKIHYDVTLTDEQLEQVIPFLTRKLWYEVGLDSSLEECLDDLILYANKRKRGERVKDAILHDAIRQALDLTVSKFTEQRIDPLYNQQV
ncbi:MAG TPA: hypothetical protein VGE59_04375, partial [Patescibacteria group bacterium]